MAMGKFDEKDYEEKSYKGLIAETREAKECLKAGAYEMAYEKIQNLEDDLVWKEIQRIKAEEEHEAKKE